MWKWDRWTHLGESGWHCGHHSCFPPLRPRIDSRGSHAGGDLSICIWLRGFFSGYFGFPPSLMLYSKVVHDLYSGSQRCLYVLLVWPCWAVLPLLWGSDERESFFLFSFFLLCSSVGKSATSLSQNLQVNVLSKHWKAFCWKIFASCIHWYSKPSSFEKFFKNHLCFFV